MKYSATAVYIPVIRKWALILLQYCCPCKKWLSAIFQIKRFRVFGFYEWIQKKKIKKKKKKKSDWRGNSMRA
jgi:hypothetical protein